MCLGKAVRVQPRGGCNRMVSYKNPVLIREKGIPIDKNGRDGSHNRYLDFKTEIIRGVSEGLALFAGNRYPGSRKAVDEGDGEGTDPRATRPHRRRYIDPTGTTFPYA